jgi:hypothetical protein
VSGTEARAKALFPHTASSRWRIRYDATAGSLNGCSPRSVCVICARALTEDDRTRCTSRPDVYFGRGYCPHHGDKIEAMNR